MIIYVINSDFSKNNITLSYYWNGLINKQKTDNPESKFYVVVHTAYGTHRMAFHGTLDDIKNIKTSICDELPDRKKIVLLNGEEPIDVDLRILDDYQANIKQFGSKAITNLADILNVLGIKATHVSIIESRFAASNIRRITDTDLKCIYRQ